MSLLFLLWLIGAFQLGYCGPPDGQAVRYLTTFGYMSGPKAPTGAASKPLEPTKYDLQVALRRFQEAFLLYPSGVVDVPTLAKMSEYRCANRDMYNGAELKNLPKKLLWNKKTLLWYLSGNPSSLTLAQTKPKTRSKADIIISFGDLGDVFVNVAAGSTRPINSQIILVKHHLWGYRNHEPRGISLFHTLLHEIGHALGLPHNFYRGSIMYPILKPAMVPYAHERLPMSIKVRTGGSVTVN
ncbi:peptidoglycan binding domain protein [Cooperia oncophora]